MICERCKKEGLRLYCTQCFKPDELEEIVLRPGDECNVALPASSSLTTK